MNKTPEPPRQAGFFATMKAVLWSFAGIRRQHDYHRDAESLNPKAVIAAGLLGGLVFVLVLVAVVNWIVP